MIEVALVIAMIVVAPVISEDPGTTAGPETTVDLEMIVVLVTGMIEEVIEVVTIGVLVHLEEEIGVVIVVIEIVVIEIVVVIAEPMIGDPLPVFCLQQEMIDEMIVVIVEMIFHRSRHPNVNKVGRKPPMVEMVGLQF